MLEMPQCSCTTANAEVVLSTFSWRGSDIKVQIELTASLHAQNQTFIKCLDVLNRWFPSKTT